MLNDCCSWSFVRSKNQVHHRGTERTKRVIFFFAHREIPMGENRISVFAVSLW